MREQVVSGFAQVDREIEQVRQRFDGVDREIGLVKSAVLENSRDLRDGLQRFEEKKVDREEIDAIVRGS